LKAEEDESKKEGEENEKEEKEGEENKEGEEGEKQLKDKKEEKKKQERKEPEIIRAIPSNTAASIILTNHVPLNTGATKVNHTQLYKYNWIRVLQIMCMTRL